MSWHFFEYSQCLKLLGILTQAIFNPLLPNQYSYNSRENIEIRLNNLKKKTVDYNIGNSHVITVLMLLLNRVRNNTHSSRELIENSKMMIQLFSKENCLIN